MLKTLLVFNLSPFLLRQHSSKYPQRLCSTIDPANLSPLRLSYLAPRRVAMHHGKQDVVDKELMPPCCRRLQVRWRMSTRQTESLGLAPMGYKSTSACCKSRESPTIHPHLSQAGTHTRTSSPSPHPPPCTSHSPSSPPFSGSPTPTSTSTSATTTVWEPATSSKRGTSTRRRPTATASPTTLKCTTRLMT